jgi:hypothetical protein
LNGAPNGVDSIGFEFGEILQDLECLEKHKVQLAGLLEAICQRLEMKNILGGVAEWPTS